MVDIFSQAVSHAVVGRGHRKISTGEQLGACRQRDEHRFHQFERLTRNAMLALDLAQLFDGGASFFSTQFGNVHK
ncbi:hypothetical protein LP414_13810 [Polaromonas sp. P1(28)-13]|nr:hypothetical protein LP414_13810 [Polaromonas sp. P1(28)-13]